MIGFLPNRTPHAIKQVHMSIEVNSFPSIIFMRIPYQCQENWQPHE